MRIYADGVFDLLHSGHIRHFKKIKQMYPECFLLVGIVSDQLAEEYKRIPYLDENTRLKMVNSIIEVDQVISDCPFAVDEEFLNKHKIDLVVHAFSDDKDIETQEECFKKAIKLGKFKRIPYHTDISTSKILNNWHTIWEKKGKETSKSLMELSGWEQTDYNADKTYNDIFSVLNIKSNDKVLEIGCGSGCSSKYFKDKCDYYGIDYSKSLVETNIMTTKSKVLVSEANSIPLKTDFFDKIFCCGVFEYFPNKDYLNQVLGEIERLGKQNCSVYLVGIRHKTHAEKKDKHKYEGVFKHSVFTENDFLGYNKKESTFGVDERFSMYKIN